jgi:hypothetical protein
MQKSVPQLFSAQKTWNLDGEKSIRSTMALTLICRSRAGLDEEELFYDTPPLRTTCKQQLTCSPWPITNRKSAINCTMFNLGTAEPGSVLVQRRV